MRPRLRWPGVGEAEARRLLVGLRDTVTKAREIRAGLSDVRELIAATAVVQELEDAVAATVEHLAAIKASTGWRHLEQRPGHRHAPVRVRTASASEASAARAVAAGVPGAEPPAVMGHGWPALARAGSALASVPEVRDGVRSPEGEAPP